jgi:hypothetical protein
MMPTRSEMCRRRLAGALLSMGACVWLWSLAVPLVSAQSGDRRLASGAGTTIVEGGTGSPGFVPVLTTIAFHAEKSGNLVKGALECLARVPAAAGGPGSAQFTVNAMYVSGQVTSAVVNAGLATLTGTAQITGLGSDSGVPFELVVHNGGPGATAVLTTRGSPS